MEPQNFRFGGGGDQTALGLPVLVGLFIAIVLILLLRRRYVIVPLMVGIFLCPPGQTFVVAGVHIFAWRVLILAGWIRLIASKTSHTTLLSGGINNIDKAFALWAIVRGVAVVLLFWQVAAVVNSCGFAWDALGGYFLFRALIRDDEDIHRVIKTCAIITAILGVTMLYERFTGFNLYGLIGGVAIIDEVRNGSIRAKGPFEHALLAGSFAVTLFPLFFWLWKSRKSRLLAITGMAASSVIPFTTACSTPVLAYVGAIIGLCLWPCRKQMRLFRWGIVATLVGLQIVMKADVWWAIQHIDIITGSSSWHRAQIIDLFIRHFSDWWLIGTKSSASWGHETWDAANQYVAEGQNAGLATLLCFLAMIRMSFGRIGSARKVVEGNRRKEWFFWIFGVTVFSHVVAFFGVSYFDQTKFSWFALLAMISAATHPVLTPKGKRCPKMEPATVSASAEAAEVLAPSISMQNA